MTDIIFDYSKYLATTNNYLDGRYFNIVLSTVYPGIISDPLIIELSENNKLKDIYNSDINLQPDIINVIRIIIISPHMRHSCVCLIDPKKKTSWFWNPRKYHKLQTIHNIIIKAVKQILCLFEEYTINDLDISIPNIKKNTCQESGYCNAYVIKFIIDWLKDDEFNLSIWETEMNNHPSDILKFASYIEDNFNDQLSGNTDIEYNFSGGGGRGMHFTAIQITGVHHAMMVNNSARGLRTW